MGMDLCNRQTCEEVCLDTLPRPYNLTRNGHFCTSETYLTEGRIYSAEHSALCRQRLAGLSALASWTQQRKDIVQRVWWCQVAAAKRSIGTEDMDRLRMPHYRLLAG